MDLQLSASGLCKCAIILIWGSFTSIKSRLQRDTKYTEFLKEEKEVECSKIAGFHVTDWLIVDWLTDCWLLTVSSTQEFQCFVLVHEQMANKVLELELDFQIISSSE